MDNLPELRDIHLPSEGVSFFPPAKGWWIILAVTLGILLTYYLCKLIWRTSAKIYAYRLLKDLKDKTNLDSAIKMSEILRRICIRKYPQAVALSGKEWIDFINSKSKKKLPQQVALLLERAPYMKNDDNSFDQNDVIKLWHFCRLWIGENL